MEIRNGEDRKSIFVDIYLMEIEINNEFGLDPLRDDFIRGELNEFYDKRLLD